jgi:hypothetical protein
VPDRGNDNGTQVAEIPPHLTPIERRSAGGHVGTQRPPDIVSAREERIRALGFDPLQLTPEEQAELIGGHSLRHAEEAIGRPAQLTAEPGAGVNDNGPTSR